MQEEPTFDSDGYPTEETLKTIREWPINGNESIAQLLSFVEKAWRYNFRIKEGEEKAKNLNANKKEKGLESMSDYVVTKVPHNVEVARTEGEKRL